MKALPYTGEGLPVAIRWIPGVSDACFPSLFHPVSVQAMQTLEIAALQTQTSRCLVSANGSSVFPAQSGRGCNR
jgi:hypothetical protein